MAAPMLIKKGSIFTSLLRQNKLLPCLCGMQQLSVRQMHKGGGDRLKAPPKEKENLDWQQKIKSMKKARLGDVKEISEKDIKEFVARIPTDDVWLQSEYPTRNFSFTEALAMHREYCQPEMFDNSDGFVKFKAVLDMRTKKQTKFIKVVKRIVVLPHNFDDQNDTRVVAICKTDEEREMALNIGAAHAGGSDIIKAIENGDIRPYEFDYIVCTSEMFDELSKIRKILQDLFPSVKSETVGTDLKAMIEHFLVGIKYESNKNMDEEDKATVEFLLGKLGMPDEHLRENLDCYLQSLDSQKRTLKGNFITEGSLLVVPFSGEAFSLNTEEYLTPSEVELEQAKLLEQQEQEMAEEKDNDESKLEASANL